MLGLAFYDCGGSFHKIFYVTTKRTNSPPFVVHVVGKMRELVPPVINLMVGKGISPDDTVLAFIQKIVAVTFDYKRVFSKIVFLMNM